MKATDLMSSPVHTCRADDSCEVPAGHMWNRDCGCVVVTNDDGTVAGIVTDRDLCMAGWTTGRALRAIQVRDVMSSPVRAVRDIDSLQDVCETMAQEQVNRVPVIDAKGRLVGLISTADILREHRTRGEVTADTLIGTLFSISRSRAEPAPALPAPKVTAAAPVAAKPESTVTIQPKSIETKPPSSPGPSSPASASPASASPASAAKPASAPAAKPGTAQAAKPGQASTPASSKNKSNPPRKN